MRRPFLLALALAACGAPAPTDEVDTDDVDDSDVVDTEVVDDTQVVDTEVTDTEVSIVDADDDGVPAEDDCDDDDADLGARADDADCDGLTTDADCDDADPTSFAVADDQDCDGAVTVLDCDDLDATSTILRFDNDCDGWERGDDCDDGDASIHPGAADAWYDGRDTDCGGDDDYDADGDGERAEGYLGGQDCDDTRDDVNPDALDVPYDGLDADCDDFSDFDADRDGYDDVAHGGDDCDDDDADISPSAEEVCDGFDQDCDGTPDSPTPIDAVAWYADDDGDGVGGGTLVGLSCDPLPGTTTSNDDCDDADDTTFPGAPERACDGSDNDCDASTMLANPGARVGGTTYATVAAAVAAASTGGTVQVCEGRHDVVDLVLTRDVTLVGLGGASGTVLDAGGVGAVVRVPATVTAELRGLTLTDGAGFDDTTSVAGGGLWVGADAEVTVTASSVEDNLAGDGAGAYVGKRAVLTLVDTEVRDNRGSTALAVGPEGGGVLVDDDATLVLVRSSIHDNDAVTGGGLSLGAGAVVDGDGASAIAFNTSLLAGAGVQATRGGARVSGVRVQANQTTNGGGGFWATDIVLTDVDISDNRAGLNGGGMWVSGAVELTNVALVRNHADIDAGGIDLFGTGSMLVLDGCRVVDNVASFFAADAGGIRVSNAGLGVVATDFGPGRVDNPPHDIAYAADGLTCDPVGVVTFAHVDGTGTTTCP